MSKQSQSKLVVLGVFFAFLAVLLALPISNYFALRKSVVCSSDDPRFAEVSKIAQTSCADCHTPGLLSKPLYADFPLAKTLIARDITKAQAAFLLSVPQLQGLQPISSMDLAKVATTIQEGTMPPRQYTLMHWNAILSPRQRQTVLAYIQDRQEDSNASLAPMATSNPFNPDPKKASLGERLFQDKRLSSDNSVSCASCHNLASGGADDKDFSQAPAGRKTSLNAPGVFNCAYNNSQFWDGRAKTLQEQVAVSMTDPNQMGAKINEVVKRLKGDTQYRLLFQKTYGAALSPATIYDALAEYEKTLVTPGAKFDRYLKGESTALDDEEKHGYELFMEKGCASCHGGVGVGGNSFNKMGMAEDYFAYREKSLKMPVGPADAGRFNVTGKISDRGKFKTPGLRNVQFTAPYFHDGTVKDLPKAVELMAQFQLGQKLKPDENAAIVAFLKTLSGRPPGPVADTLGK